MSNLLDWLVQNEPSFRKTRLPSLFSDLAVQKTTNPEGFSANVTAWQDALVRAALAGKLPSSSATCLEASDKLLDALASPQYGRPTGFGLVLDECVRSGNMMDVKEFKASQRSIYNKSWIPSPMTMLKWGLRQAGIVRTASYETTRGLRIGQLVLIPVLEELSEKILSIQAEKGDSLTDRIISREYFLKSLNIAKGTKSSHTFSKEDVDILLQYLSRDRHALSYNSNTIKFALSTSILSSNISEPITSTDESIASLKSVISNLETQISTLNVQIQTQQAAAANAVKQGSKPLAISALRSKKRAEMALTSRADTLAQLEEVYGRLSQAADQIEIVNVMQSSAVALKTLNSQVGGVERVEDIVDKLREEMSQTEQVGQVLQEPLGDTTQAMIDEGEVDDELEAMEREEREKKEAVERALREQKEEKVAEATRKRLAELERLGDKPVANDPQSDIAKKHNVDFDKELASSTERLNDLKIQEDRSDQQTPEKTTEMAM